jgi:U-box domain
VPAEFLCAINSHIMKQPVRSPHGHVFERSTILLWLETRGRVCPLTGKPLIADELVTDEELRSRIMRWHIQRTSMNAKPVLEGVSAV